jgi:tetratricopeptide (TPR) repeat protein
MHLWRAISGWRFAVFMGAGLLAAALLCPGGWAEPDWRRPSLSEFEVREDPGADQEAVFYKKFYRAVRIELRDIPGARKLYEELLAERPGTAYLYYKLAILDAREQDFESYIENLKTALEHDPTLQVAYDHLERLYGFWGRQDELADLYEQAIEHIKPNNTAYYLKLAELYTGRKEPEKAIEVYKRAIAEHPVRYEAWLKLFELQLDAGDEAQASATLHDAFEATGGHRQLLVGARELYLEKGDDERAFALTELLVERFPLRADFWIDDITALLRNGETARARAAFEKSCGYVVAEPGYLAHVVRLFSMHADVDTTVAVLEHALDCVPDSLESLLALSILYQAQGKAEQARALQERLLALGISDERVLGVIAIGYEQEKDYEAFGQWVQRALAVNPNSFDVRFALLRYDEATGKTDEASTLLDALLDDALSGDQPDVEACLRLCEYYLDEDKYDAVRRIASRGLDVTAQRAQVRRLYYYSGMADYHEHRIPDAARKLRIASRTETEHADARFYLGLCYLRLGRPEDAVDAIERAVRMSPGNPYWETKLGEALKRTGRAEEADARFGAVEGTLEQAIEHSPEDAELHVWAGSLLGDMGRVVDAERELKKAIELDPKSAEALNSLGYMWAEEGMNLDEALELIKRALEIEPDSGPIVDSLGWVYFKQGRYKDALRELERAVELGPPNATIYDHVGDTHLKLDDKAKAIEWWNKAIELYPEDAELIRTKIVEHGGTPPETPDDE